MISISSSHTLALTVCRIPVVTGDKMTCTKLGYERINTSLKCFVTRFTLRPVSGESFTIDCGILEPDWLLPPDMSVLNFAFVKFGNLEQSDVLFAKIFASCCFITSFAVPKEQIKIVKATFKQVYAELSRYHLQSNLYIIPYLNY